MNEFIWLIIGEAIVIIFICIIRYIFYLKENKKIDKIINAFKKPLLTIIPIPIRIIIKLDNTAKFAKLETVDVNIYLRPLKLNKDLTASVVTS